MGQIITSQSRAIEQYVSKMKLFGSVEEMVKNLKAEIEK